MSTLRLPAKTAPPAPPAPDPAPAPAAAAPPKRTIEEGAERARVQAELKRRQSMEARQRREQRIRLGLAALRQHWPELFTRPVPLAIGLTHQIRTAVPEMPLAQFNHAMRFWTQRTAYLLTVAAGMERRNLDGTPAGVTNEEQQAFAQDTPRRHGKWPVEAQGAAEVPVVGEQPEV